MKGGRIRWLIHELILPIDDGHFEQLQVKIQYIYAMSGIRPEIAC